MSKLKDWEEICKHSNDDFHIRDLRIMVSMETGETTENLKALDKATLCKILAYEYAYSR